MHAVDPFVHRWPIDHPVDPMEVELAYERCQQHQPDEPHGDFGEINVEQDVALGQDTERAVLSRAVRYWAEDRILLVSDKTVVFP